ncbi:MAG: hypothetical protein RQ826_15725 [Xanthomonadales bacterium]|nr:hypothetical protein [Xanthomonadales bacterium]
MFIDGEQLKPVVLPYEVQDLVLAGSRFHLKPQLKALEYDRPFFMGMAPSRMMSSLRY